MGLTEVKEQPPAVKDAHENPIPVDVIQSPDAPGTFQLPKKVL